MIELRLLGPLEIASPTGLLDAGPPQRRAVLAALAADAGRPVSSETLIDRVWDDQPPPGARRALHVHISRLRGLLQPDADGGAGVSLRQRSGGYVLETTQVDWFRFRQLIRESHGDGADRADLLGQALHLWRGAPLADVPGAWAARTRATWRRHHVDAAVRWTEALLTLGRHAAVIDPVRDLLIEYPLAEPLAAALLRALVAADRDAEALDCFAATRARLLDELGTEPGPVLQHLHQAILRGTLRRPSPTTPRRPSGAPTTTPSQLPAAIPGFVGRHAEIAALNHVLDGQPGRGLASVSGGAGVGKTALVVQWARRVADRFPDGQLFADLRGFGPDPTLVATPQQVLRGFLDALGVPTDRVPHDFTAAVGLYRTLLAERRILVVLDNAPDAEHVRPLLPAGTGSVTVVTSRRQMAGLVVSEGAHPIALDVLHPVEAVDLLTVRLGPGRVSAEPDASNSIVARCGHLPLALAIVAARALLRPRQTLSALAAELDEATTLAGFDGGDPTADLRAVYSWSYRRLDAAAARMFRLVGLHPGPHFTVAAAASLAGVAIDAAARAIRQLVALNLLVETTPDRFGMHDLLRMYSHELAGELEAADRRDEAASRLVDHYLHTAFRANRLIAPSREPILLPPAGDGVSTAAVGDYDEAMAWFADELPALRAVVRLASSTGHDGPTWKLAWTLADFLQVRGHWLDWVDIQTTAVAAAQRSRNIPALAQAHRLLARAYVRLRRCDDADRHFDLARGYFHQLGDDRGEALVHLGLTWVAEARADLPAALAHATAAIGLYRRIGERRGLANAYNSAGWFHARLGSYEAAIQTCRQAVALHATVGDPVGQAYAWDSIGFAYHQMGAYDDALAAYRTALDLRPERGDRQMYAGILGHVGDTHHAVGADTLAREHWRRAADVLAEVDEEAAAALRSR